MDYPQKGRLLATGRDTDKVIKTYQNHNSGFDFFENVVLSLGQEGSFQSVANPSERTSEGTMGTSVKANVAPKIHTSPAQRRAATDRFATTVSHHQKR
jgi:hypothetical protein